MDAERLSRLLQYQAQDPANFSLCVDIGFLQLTLNQLSDAKNSAHRAIEIAPNKCSGYALHGVISVREGDFNTAVTMLSQAVALGETAPSVFYNYAYALAHLGKYAEAELPAAHAAQYPADLPHAPALYIRVLHYLGKIEEAITFAETVAKCDSPPNVNGMLSTLYMDTENLESARTAALNALNEDSENSDARTTLGLLALQDLDAGKAAVEFDHALAADQNQGRALLGKGLSVLLSGNLPDAAAIFERVVTQTNMAAHIGSWHTLAWCYILQKNIPAAEQALQHSLVLDRNFAETHGGLAIVALMRGNIDSAIQSAKRAQGLDKNNFSGNFAQGLIQQVSGNSAQAAAIIDKVLNQRVLPDGRSIQSLLVERMVRGEKSIPENETVH
jgi:tetratricopeptide (TPR) repeat protein